MSLTCCDCGRSIARSGTRGRNPKRCDWCRTPSRHAKNRYRPKAGEGPHLLACGWCKKSFKTARRKQKHCSPECKFQASKTCVLIGCAYSQCQNLFLVTPSQYKKGTRCCSRACKVQHARRPPSPCQNPSCGRPIPRPQQGPRRAALGQDHMKYCSRQCYYDHRFGADRPKRPSAPSRNSSSVVSPHRTSLRKKCKVLGVPHDEQCTREAVCDRDNWVCQICGVRCNRAYVIDPVSRKIDKKNAEHDHIVPLTAVGSPGNVFPNSQCLCRKCNNKKSNSSIGQLRLDLEGSIKRWESGARGRRLQNSRCSRGIRVAVL